MAYLGFSIKFPALSRPDAWSLELTYRRYGAPETLEDAQKYGYGVPPEDSGDDEGARDRSDEFTASLTPEARVALGGVFGAERVDPRYRNGCIGEADRKLMGDAKLIELSGLGFSSLTRELNLDPRSTDSPESRAAKAEFSRCMAGEGYPGLEGPLDDPEGLPVFKEPPTPAVIKAAVTHFHCAESSQVKVIMRETEAKFQLAAIEKNPEAFAQLKAENEAVIRRAVTVVKG